MPVPFDDAVARYAPVLGMETHVELSTASKMWCGCSTRFGDEPNTNTCPVCLALPGALPVTNAEAVRATVLIGLALHCDIARRCRFARKNYFYPDMPKNFQISQYDEPLCTDGWLDVGVDGTTVRVEVERVHLEEDTGKTLHVGGATGRIHGATHSLVDYNRAGIPLVEIVSRPVAGTGERVAAVARAYAQTLRDVVAGLGRLRRAHGAGVAALRRQRLPRSSRCALGDAHRDQERELLPQRGAGGARGGGAPGGPAGRRGGAWSWRRGTSTSSPRRRARVAARRPPRTTATSREPDLVPLAPDPAWVEELRASLPEEPQRRRERLAAELAASPVELEAMANAGVLDLVAATAAAGAPPGAGPRLVAVLPGGAGQRRRCGRPPTWG